MCRSAHIRLVGPFASAYRTTSISACWLNFGSRHVLSNVGRVAARDSSRTTATVNDLFTALCEDASIYPYFRTMKGAAEASLIFPSERVLIRSFRSVRTNRAVIKNPTNVATKQVLHTQRESVLNIAYHVPKPRRCPSNRLFRLSIPPIIGGVLRC